MKNVLVAMVLVLAVAAAAQQAPAGQQPAGQQPAQQKKEIKDPAEYNSYVGALQAPDAQQKITSLEDFLLRYPNTVVKEDALEALMGAYQQAGNAQKTIETANRLLQVNPNNLAGLAVNVFVMRSSITGPSDPKLAQMRDMAQRGLQSLQTSPMPEGITPADWEKRKAALATVFHGGLGFAALQQQDYPTAQQHLRAAVNANPENFADVYPLALAYLQARPMVMEGLWFAARAVNLAPQQAQAQIAKWAEGRYRKFHGDVDGWPELMAQAATQPLPPAGFKVTPAPTPAEYAEKLLATKSINQLSNDEIELILTSGNQAGAQKVWAGLKGVPQQFVAVVVDVPAKNRLMLAFTADAIEQNKANVDLTMAGPIPASLMPKPGAQLKLQGTPVSYEVTPASGNTPPALMMTMNDGALLTSAKPAAKPAPRRRRR